MKTRIQRINIYFLVIVFIAATLWLTILEVAYPLLFSNGDSITMMLPWYVHNWRSVVENQTISLINLQQYLGYTQYTQAASGVLYPPIYIAVGLSKLIFRDFLHSMDILVTLHLLTAAAITYLFLRKLRNTPTISLLISLLWITSPYLITTSKAWVFGSYLAVFLPLNFLLLERLINKIRPVNIFALSVLKMFFLFSGYIPTFFMLLVMEIIYICFILAQHINNNRLQKAKRLLFAYLSSIALLTLLGSIIILPLYEAKQLSYLRSAPRPYSEFMRYYVTFKDFVDSQLFKFRPKALFQANSHVFYTGIFLLSLPLTLLNRKLRHKTNKYKVIAYGQLALVSYLLSTSLHGYLYNVPIFNVFRGPHKYFLFFYFFLLVAIAGITSTFNHRKSFINRQAIHFILVLSLLLNVLVVLQNKKDSMDNIRIILPANTSGFELLNKNEGRVFTYQAPKNDKTYYRYLTYNFASLFNISHFAGYGPMVSKLNFNLSLKLHHASNYTKKMDKPLLDYLSSWSVKYFLTNSSKSTQRHLESFPQIKLIYQDKELSIYKNKAARPYVYEPGRPQMKIPFAFGVNRLDVYPSNMKAHQLIVSLAPLPNYVIYADNKKIGKVIPNNGPITINVPANTKHLAIRYIDPLFNIGIGIFITTWLVIILFYLISYKRRKLRQKIMGKIVSSILKLKSSNNQ